MEGDSPFLFCDICNVQSSSDSQHRSHLLGKRHWHNKRLKEESQRSIYVRGFQAGSSSITEEELLGVFKSFGSIHKIIMDPKGVYAIIEFSGVDSALDVLHYQQPLVLRDVPLTVRPREFKTKITKKANKELDDTCSSGMDKQEEEDSFENDVEVPGHDDVLRKKFNLQDDAIEDIKQQTSFEKQLSALVDHLQLKQQDTHYRVMILGRLQTLFAEVFPSAHVIPIGTMATGLSTPSSDVDVVLITDWNETDQLHFGHNFTIQERTIGYHVHSPSRYLGEELEEEMEVSNTEIPFSSAIPPIAECLTKFSFPPGIKLCGSEDMSSCSEEYKTALRIISGAPGFSKILAITTARCPIIKFTDSATGISCDLSINNRFGLYNSKLIKAYVTHDSRLVHLLFVLRVWTQASGIKPSDLNNYALALMLIYFLQRTSPPVVPNLQNVGTWPRNMEWIGHQGVLCKGNLDVADMILDGWKYKMVDNKSLAQSSNKLSSIELLHDFFNFYGSHFSFATHSISVHTPADTVTTIEQACTMASEGASPEVPERYKKFKVTSLCVQDPIELGHNVGKSLSPKKLEILKKAMQKSCMIVEELIQMPNSNILSLFGYKQTQPLLHSITDLPRTHRIIPFNKERIISLFSKLPCLAELACHIKVLDTTSEYLKSRVRIVVLRALVSILENDFGFSCASVTEKSVPEKMQPLTLDPSEQVTAEHVKSRSLLLTKRPREDEEDKEVETEETVEDWVDESVVEGQQKRVRLESDMGQSPTAMLERQCLTDDNKDFPSMVRCTAAANTWIHRRQMKRQQEKGQSAFATPNHPPVLQFVMTSLDPKSDPYMLDATQADVWIEMCVIEDVDIMIKEFHTFYAFFKKLVLSG